VLYVQPEALLTYYDVPTRYAAVLYVDPEVCGPTCSIELRGKEREAVISTDTIQEQYKVAFEIFGFVGLI